MAIVEIGNVVPWVTPSMRSPNAYSRRLLENSISERPERVSTTKVRTVGQSLVTGLTDMRALASNEEKKREKRASISTTLTWKVSLAKIPPKARKNAKTMSYVAMFNNDAMKHGFLNISLFNPPLTPSSSGNLTNGETMRPTHGKMENHRNTSRRDTKSRSQDSNRSPNTKLKLRARA